MLVKKSLKSFCLLNYLIIYGHCNLFINTVSLCDRVKVTTDKESNLTLSVITVTVTVITLHSNLYLHFL